MVLTMKRETLDRFYLQFSTIAGLTTDPAILAVCNDAMAAIQGKGRYSQGSLFDTSDFIPEPQGKLF